MRSLISNLLFVYVFIATGCGGGGSDTPNTTYNITGSVSGLESGTLVLQVT